MHPAREGAALTPEQRIAELEACLHACDPYEGGQSMCDAALERIAREKEVAAPLTTGAVQPKIEGE